MKARKNAGRRREGQLHYQSDDCNRNTYVEAITCRDNHHTEEYNHSCGRIYPPLHIISFTSEYILHFKIYRTMHNISSTTVYTSNTKYISTVESDVHPGEFIFHSRLSPPPRNISFTAEYIIHYRIIIHYGTYTLLQDTECILDCRIQEYREYPRQQNITCPVEYVQHCRNAPLQNISNTA
jgi:hypothetical protein